MNRFGIHLDENHFNFSLPIPDALKVELWFFGIPLNFFESHNDKPQKISHS